MNGARVSGGTFGAVSASNLTSVPSSAPIFSAFDSLGASTCLAKINGGGNMSPSATLGGSNFGPATVQGGRFGNSVSGTWRVMGGGITDAATADRTAHGVEIFNACKAGTYGTIGDYVAPKEEESSE